MSKNSSTAAYPAARGSMMSVRTLAVCALLAAMSVVLARFVIPMPAADQRYSLEAVPIFIAGMLFGPLPAAMVGFSADLVGCLFSGYGYNPLLCLPPILYGLCAGFFRPLLAKKTSPWTIALAFFPAVLFGSVLYQSAMLAYIYGKGAFWPNFMLKLTARSIQFSVTFVLDVVIVWLLCKSHVFQAVHLWPPAPKKQSIKP